MTGTMTTVKDTFGCKVFNDSVMKDRLPRETYAALRRTMAEGRHLDLGIAHVVANAMKDWAIEQGATHFTHWFQPMTGITAEKHDSFLSPDLDGKVIMEFSGRELVQGEPDASSLPSGGLRATFEARGYTAWDPTSYAFIKGNTLCIPTAFCSYGGEALDKKTPLLRSMEAINRQALRVLRLFGHDNVRQVKTMVGAEQEYFLIDRELFEKRQDLQYTGRTLFGRRPPKGQELGDHYFAVITPRVEAYMKDLDAMLWDLGICAKTEHNETAPAQHELAPVYTTTNIATDQNQLIMECMRKVARQHGMVCLLHEKPFAGVNGSGKHNNWSITTDTGINLLRPGDTPHENAQFLLFLCAVLQAVDDYQDLLRIATASAGNDNRLGGHEAPPAVISVFLGDELTAILESLERDQPYDAKEQVTMRLGVHVLPRFPKDTTDRNRTSPFAFTGNKFEFRMLGSSASIADVNTMLNTAVAESLRQFADAAELQPKENFHQFLHDWIRDTIRAHRRIVFNGNGYDQTWIREATEVRGLLNLPTTPDCLPYLLHEKNVALFAAHKVFSEAELHSRYEILQDNYCKLIHIEALTMSDIVRQSILPAVSQFTQKLCVTLKEKQRLGLKADYESDSAARLSELESLMLLRTETLEAADQGASEAPEVTMQARLCHDGVCAAMKTLREAVDEAERLMPAAEWPLPSYGELLFGVH